MSDQNERGRFKVGNKGRPRGSRNRLTGDLLEALAEEFAESGKDSVRIVAKEDPAQFLKIVASLVPKELDINDNRLKDIPDDELDTLIELARQRLASVGGARRVDEREDKTAH